VERKWAQDDRAVGPSPWVAAPGRRHRAGGPSPC